MIEQLKECGNAAKGEPGMSAQAGVWNFDGKPADEVLVERLSQAIGAYSPDGGGAYVDGSIAMVYRAFHTTPESRLEHQPHASPRGFIILWDGRLDNREELIFQLRDSLRADQTDVAIVAAAFDRWETGCFHRLIGDWAVSVWNSRRLELILARDYLGVRTLFYHLQSLAIIWSTGLVPLTTLGGTLTLCEQYVASYLALWPEPQLTPYRELHSVPPGHLLRIRDGQATSHAYWNVSSRSTARYKDDREYEQHFVHMFRQAVRRRLRSDSPVLADLSGGLDSSSVVCMADDIIAKQESATVLDTFSFYDPHEPDEDDVLYFGRVEEQRKRVGYHAELHRGDDAFTVDYSSFVAEPGFDTRQGLKEAKSAVIKQGRYRVVLSGTGGDEILGNALDPRVQLADLLVQLRLGALSKQLFAWSLVSRQPMIQLFYKTLWLLLPQWLRARATAESKVAPWVDKGFANRCGLYSKQLVAAEGCWYWLPSMRDSFQALKGLSGQLTHTRPTTYEVRYPYLDRCLVEFLLSIPTTQLLRPGERRRLMRGALAHLLPPEILSRGTKSGTGRCISITLQTHWDAVRDALESPLIAELGFIDGPQFRSSLEAAKSGRLERDIVMLLKGLSLELWLRDAASRKVISLPSRHSLLSRSQRKYLGADA